jgi:hypothetical protein
MFGVPISPLSAPELKRGANRRFVDQSWRQTLSKRRAADPPWRLKRSAPLGTPDHVLARGAFDAHTERKIKMSPFRVKATFVLFARRQAVAQLTLDQPVKPRRSAALRDLETCSRRLVRRGAPALQLFPILSAPSGRGRRLLRLTGGYGKLCPFALLTAFTSAEVIVPLIFTSSRKVALVTAIPT